MTPTGIERIDRLLEGAAPAAPIVPGDADAESVEVVQELLRNHDLRKVPGRGQWRANPFGEAFGTFGTRTEKAVKFFKDKHRRTYGFPTPTTADVDTATLLALVNEPASTPGAGRAYLTVALARMFDIWTKTASLISTYEESPTAGGFPGQSPPGMDAAGLSYGLLQWTHRSKRLHGLLAQFRAEQADLFARTFAMPPLTLDGLMEHLDEPETRLLPSGATKPEFAAFDLFARRWRDRFKAAGLKQPFQRIQADQAVRDQKAAFRFLKDPASGAGAGYATLLNSQWAVAFWLDLSNQLGLTRGKTRYEEVVAALGPAATEQQILDRVVTESDFPERREYFRDRAPYSKTDPFPAP